MEEERKAHYRNKSVNQEKTFIAKYWSKIHQKAKLKELYYKHVGREKQFEKVITAKNAIARKNDQGDYELENVL